jgi:hypothetical protein
MLESLMATSILVFNVLSFVVVRLLLLPFYIVWSLYKAAICL